MDTNSVFSDTFSNHYKGNDLICFVRNISLALKNVKFFPAEYTNWLVVFPKKCPDSWKKISGILDTRIPPFCNSGWKKLSNKKKFQHKISHYLRFFLLFLTLIFFIFIFCFWSLKISLLWKKKSLLFSKPLIFAAPSADFHFCCHDLKWFKVCMYDVSITLMHSRLQEKWVCWAREGGG